MTNAEIFRHKEPHQGKVPKTQPVTIDRGRGELSFRKPHPQWVTHFDAVSRDISWIL
jgi:hypothetical protein